jgi:hypothetical protein
MIWYFDKYGEPHDHIENCKILKNFTNDPKLLLTLNLAISKFEELELAFKRVEKINSKPTISKWSYRLMLIFIGGYLILLVIVIIGRILGIC